MTNYGISIYCIAVIQFLVSFVTGYFHYKAFQLAKQARIGILSWIGCSIIGLYCGYALLSYSRIFLLPLPIRPFDRIFLPIIGFTFLMYGMYRGVYIARERSQRIESLSEHHNQAIKRFDDAVKKL